ncbi:rop guanine nucleotide exchange factor 3-like [Dendrobium catenatum]|uniref:rop guanine nucleotide exchange factor 3-like n=1 Tax=Dendrobium catenatum TaxID=906689 RepID=UPI0009F71565|nr:rop guanine nucleotide exchange factor 3-like [Dendrobium catenatum]
MAASAAAGKTVMATRPRSDLYINLPALEKLDAMLLEILESFEKTEFWYVDDGDRSPSANISRSFRRVLKRNEEKWWRPIPCLPSYGLTAKSRKDLKQKRDCANQIHKAAMAINNGILAEMDVPDSFFATLPKYSMKIQYNKDLGQAILESYSRVLESFAFNLVSYIDDVLYIDESVKKR